MKVSYLVVRSDLDLQVQIYNGFLDLARSWFLPSLLGWRLYLATIFIWVSGLISFALSRMLVSLSVIVPTILWLLLHFKFGFNEVYCFRGDWLMNGIFKLIPKLRFSNYFPSFQSINQKDQQTLHMFNIITSNCPWLHCQFAFNFISNYLFLSSSDSIFFFCLDCFFAFLTKVSFSTASLLIFSSRRFLTSFFAIFVGLVDLNPYFLRYSFA